MNTVVPFNQSLRDCLREAHSRIRTATQSVAKTQKAHFDKRVKNLQFTQGQLVWLFWPNPPRLQRFKKLLWLWTGPWQIEHFLTDVVVKLRHTQTQQRQTVHVNRLSPCVSSDPNSVLDSSSEEPLATSTEIPAETEHQSSTVLDASSSPHPALTDRPRRKRRLPVALEPYVLEV